MRGWLGNPRAMIVCIQNDGLITFGYFWTIAMYGIETRKSYTVRVLGVCMCQTDPLRSLTLVDVRSMFSTESKPSCSDTCRWCFQKTDLPRTWRHFVFVLQYSKQFQVVTYSLYIYMICVFLLPLTSLPWFILPSKSILFNMLSFAGGGLIPRWL